jgi:alkylation response protein AidB-like acyl-CoA dehydrogenase
MDFTFSSDQEALREAVRRTVERDLQPLVDAHEEHALPREVFLRVLAVLARHRLTAPRLPADAGGAGLSMLDYGLVFEQLPPYVAMNLLAHEGCTARLFLEGTEAQKARLLPAMLAGKRIGCTGSTEPDAGSDPRGIRTRLVREDGVLKLYGRKMWVTNAAICDLMIVTCLDGRVKLGRDVTKVVVERARTPFESREIEMMGLRQGYLGEAVFDGCVIPDENVIESSSGGTSVLKQTWNVSRPLVGLQAVHLAQKAFDAAVEYSTLRKQFGKPIGGHQLIQKTLADMATSIEASRLLCYSALAKIDNGVPAEGASAMAKRYAQNACEQVVREAMNVLGAMGLSSEARIEKLYRDVRMLSIPDGTNELLALIHGRELTGIAAFRDAPARPAG